MSQVFNEPRNRLRIANSRREQAIGAGVAKGRKPSESFVITRFGRAYLQKLFTVGGGPEAGVWGTKADKAFDGALAIDDHNWDARFAKAVSLSFWPPMLGKQNEAIKNFEVLVEQQSAQSSKSEFAQTYYFLGNMYTQTGDKDKALVWLEKAFAERADGLTWLNVEPMLDEVRSDPRFQDLIRRIGLV